MALLFDPTELARYGGLTLVARNVVEGFLTGIHRSPFKGFSVEFAEHRQYYPGDEIRHLDWRLLAKTDRYYIKEYEEETNLKAYLVIDASGSMGYKGKQKLSKFQYAQQVAASMAYLMLAQLDAVGLVTHDTRVTGIVPPKTSSKHLLHLLRTLEGMTPGGETALAPIWHSIAGQHLKRRGMVILLSDCFDKVDDLARALQHLKHRNHDVLLFHILAPEEVEFPFKNPTKFRNLEVNGQEITTDARRLREEYLKNFEEYRQTLKRKADDLQVDYVMLRTDDPVDRALGAYLARRNLK
ncbi:DUF58 domain-containing protein [Limnoglobus roseus]|uniref:VWFA domain-containing protein n=1 Tax=Limnoglobus roseus TaxID=2598579 RepID=A0A5C1AR10_9BACT|nr:DUF58 domain-containing protein [Limnoglobus roseus]QEL20172.1 hypothetical protein PX52LOC_07260 [Limnoglobus roseus]